jgi:gamma-glutamylcyclotransferase (GGCT)/AIG2-like uncharacterized protein YtfP
LDNVPPRELPLFVYGTLLTNAGHRMGALLRANARRIGPGSFPGKLYIVPDPDDPANSYPGAVPGPANGNLVHGELYEITGDAEDLLAKLDAFEECGPDRAQPHEFLRREILVTRPDGHTRAAMAYLYTWDVSEARPIPSGRYTENGAHVR